MRNQKPEHLFIYYICKAMHDKMINRDFIIKLLEQNANDIKSFGVSRIGLFGSFVKRKQKPDSDIDFLVEFKPYQKKYKNFIRLAFYLEDLFDAEIDLLTKKSLSPYLGPDILKDIEYINYND